MLDLLFNNGAAWFTVPAITATVIFAVQFILMLTGFDDGGLDLDIDLATDAGHSNFVFHILSFQTVASFVMGFGWGAFASYRGANWDFTTSVLVGAVCGAGMVWLLYLLLKALHDLQTSGNVRIKAAIGKTGQVYVSIPSEGAGQVRLIMGSRERTYTARSPSGPLGRGDSVRVTRVNEDNSLTVERA